MSVAAYASFATGQLASGGTIQGGGGGEGGTELPFPAEAFGLIAFGILVAMLLGTLAFGKGRRHS